MARQSAFEINWPSTMHYFWLQSSWRTLSSKNRHDKDHTRFLVFVSDPLKIESCHVTFYLFIFSVWNAHGAIAVSRHKSQGDHDSNPQSQARNAWISKFRGSVTSKRLIQTKSSQSTVLGYVMFSPFIRSNWTFYIPYAHHYNSRLIWNCSQLLTADYRTKYWRISLFCL